MPILSIRSSDFSALTCLTDEYSYFVIVCRALNFQQILNLFPTMSSNYPARSDNNNSVDLCRSKFHLLSHFLCSVFFLACFYEPAEPPGCSICSLVLLRRLLKLTHVETSAVNNNLHTEECCYCCVVALISLIWGEKRIFEQKI